MPNNNPEGKGGLGEHPENRNIGRKKRGDHLLDLVDAELKEMAEIKAGDKDVEMTWEQAFVKVLVRDAIRQDGQSRRILMQYIVGMPNQMLELSGKLDVDETVSMRVSEMTDKEFDAFIKKKMDRLNDGDREKQRTNGND